MIAVLRQVVDAGSGEGGRWAGMRMHLHPQRRHGQARRLVQAQRRVGVPDHAARRGPARRRGLRPRARREHRRALHLRPRRPARGGLSQCRAPADRRSARMTVPAAAAARARLPADRPRLLRLRRAPSSPPALLVPLVEALLVWFVLNALARGVRPAAGRRPARPAPARARLCGGHRLRRSASGWCSARSGTAAAIGPQHRRLPAGARAADRAHRRRLRHARPRRSSTGWSAPLGLGARAAPGRHGDRRDCQPLQHRGDLCGLHVRRPPVLRGQARARSSPTRTAGRAPATVVGQITAASSRISGS